MNYSAELRQEAVEDLDRLGLSVSVLSQFFDHLSRLEADPLGLSRPPGFPFARLNARMFEFFCRDSEGKRHFTVFFHFGDNEKTLIVTHIGHTYYGM